MELFERMRETSSLKGITKEEYVCYRNGYRICGTEYRPEGDRLPVAIICHGLMAFQDMVRPYAEMLAAFGYVTYCFDFCGGSAAFGKSEGKTTEMSVLTEMEDLEAVIDHVRKLPYTGDEILLFGCSQGGLVAALTAVKRQEMGRLILLYPAFNIPDQMRKGEFAGMKFDPENIPEVVRYRGMKLGKRYVKDAMSLDVYGTIGKFSGPVLIMHGTNDELVSEESVRLGWEVYRDRQGNAPCEWEMIEGAGHGFSGEEDEIVRDAVGRFVRAR